MPSSSLLRPTAGAGVGAGIPKSPCLSPLKSNPPLQFPIRTRPPYPIKIACSGDKKTLTLTVSAIPAAVGAAALIGLLTAPEAAIAASGGRVGGSSFSSYPSSSSSSSSAPSYSSPSSSYGSSSSSSYSGSWGPSSSTAISESYSYSVGQLPPRPMTGVDKTLLWGFGGLVVAAIGCVVMEGRREAVGPGITIHKIQVGLLGMARDLQKDLDYIAETVNTSTSEGLHYVLTETVLALLRHPDCWISAHSSVALKRTRGDGEKEFGRLSIEERGKFDEETLVNSNNIKRRKTIIQEPKGRNEYIVVTILVAVVGKHKLPVINGTADLKEALQRLGSVPSNITLAVEVLWTPQNENDILTQQQLHSDYPHLTDF